MITLQSAARCLQCLPVPVRPVPAGCPTSAHTFALFHFWHQTQGEAFSRAMAEALGEIEAVAALLDGNPEAAACAHCRRTVAHCVAGILLELAERIRTLPTWPDRSALAAALTARNAAIEGDPLTVDAFSGAWLRLHRPADWREAVEMALLGEWVHVLGDGTADSPALLGLLRRHVATEHVHLRPLWERKSRGRRTALLSTPVGEGLVLADLLVAPGLPEELALADEFGDPRIAPVLRRLREPEERLARSWARDGEPWALTATAAGLPEAYGERVRRKLKRLGLRYSAAAAAAPEARRPCT
ncbi:hypothetical protein ABZZ17_25960 [Streptomyces sp. NPDC006512]|uniref:hypothetical protein n=1 Tax=Streptomyces sp. NPDC006512 TaxID=3154307 RepID=UPI0033B31898